MFENIHWPTVVFGSLIGVVIIFIIQSRRTLRKSINFLNEEEFSAGMRKAQLIDVRRKNEFDTGHINGSRNIPWTTLNKNVNKLRTDQPVYLVCANGKISKRATAILVTKNFSEIYGLQGGITSWTKPLKTKK